ncbi:MAG TPA: DUF4139 domain-containing protein [Candidatus Limnocylindrales bacterium]|nr:DUF4139 domain-containing protein [Candidatus Limnocylindrales bacterium]
MTLLEAPIVAVTVFPDRARITRRGAARLPAGQQKVAFGPLPHGLLHDSVRVAGDGPATVLGVDVVTRRSPVSLDPEVAEIEERIRAIDASIASLADADAVATSRERFLGRIAMRSASTYAAGDVAAAARFADDIDAQLSDVKQGARQRVRERELLVKEREAAQRRLGDLRGRSMPDELVAEVNLEVAEEADIRLELSYVTVGAAWYSTYDLRLTGEQLTLSWFGLVTQHTGEDWPECELKLSTARPGAALEVPELDPWYLDRMRPVPPPRPIGYMMDAAPMPAAPAPMQVAETMAFKAAAGKREAVQDRVAAVDQGPTAATYTPTRPVAVPADGTAHRATLATFELEAKLDHVAAPVRSAEATLRATIRNSSSHTLPEATASLFHEGDFVGSARIEAWAPQEERELALGVDDRVRVERELVKRGATKAALGSARRVDAEYEITVANHSPRSIKVTVLDQLPVSRDAQITVRETLVKPDPSERDDLGIITWKAELEPFARATFHLGFRVESAKGVDLAGWRD